MYEFDLPEPIASLADRLVVLPNAVAVTLGDWQAEDNDLSDGEWILHLYHLGEFNPAGLSHLDGTVAIPGKWSRLRNGEGKLAVGDYRVQVHPRDIEEVRRWIGEAENGRFEIDGVHGSLAGVPTYTLAAEVALGKVLAGSLDLAVDYPDLLAENGAKRWRIQARSSLEQAHRQAAHGDAEGVLAHLARACIEVAHARLSEARRWTVNEKEILERAELTHLNQLLTAINADPMTLLQRVMQARTLLLD